MAKWDHDDLMDKTRQYYEGFGVPAVPPGGQPVVTNTPRPGETPEQIAARYRDVAHLPYREALEALRPSQSRTFSTGATRDTDEGKLDFEGFLSPLVLEEFAKYMNEKRKMPDGSLRDSDNWQKGIPLDAYMKSMWRHFFSVWKEHRNGHVDKEELLALLFNVQGYAHEVLKRGR